MSSDASDEYLYPQSGHDYQSDWDYEAEIVPNDVMAMTEQIAGEIRCELLPQLRVFKTFTFAYVRGRKRGRMATYADGTVSEPCVLLHHDEIVKACARFDVDIEVAIETSLTHELGHAFQEALCLPKVGRRAEERAEALAHMWHFEHAVHPYFTDARYKK